MSLHSISRPGTLDSKSFGPCVVTSFLISLVMALETSTLRGARDEAEVTLHVEFDDWLRGAGLSLVAPTGDTCCDKQTSAALDGALVPSIDFWRWVQTLKWEHACPTTRPCASTPAQRPSAWHARAPLPPLKASPVPPLPIFAPGSTV